jgi:hypothetical protein
VVEAAAGVVSLVSAFAGVDTVVVDEMVLVVVEAAVAGVAPFVSALAGVD